MTTLQAPPQSIETYELSWDRNTQLMRFRHYDEYNVKDGEWEFVNFSGDIEFVGEDQAGHLYVRGMLVANGDTGYWYLDEELPPSAFSGEVRTTAVHDHSTCQIVNRAPFPSGRDTHWRFCYARDLAEKSQAEGRNDIAYWRARDERLNERDGLWLVHGYRGKAHISQFDYHSSHIFITGPLWLGEDGIAYTFDPKE